MKKTFTFLIALQTELIIRCIRQIQSVLLYLLHDELLIHDGR